jgi:hypothetical protein
MVSTGLTRARRSQAALALDPIPASKVQSGHTKLQNLTSTTGVLSTVNFSPLLEGEFTTANNGASGR